MVKHSALYRKLPKSIGKTKNTLMTEHKSLSLYSLNLGPLSEFQFSRYVYCLQPLQMLSPFVFHTRNPIQILALCPKRQRNVCSGQGSPSWYFICIVTFQAFLILWIATQRNKHYWSWWIQQPDREQPLESRRAQLTLRMLSGTGSFLAQQLPEHK